MKQWSKYSAILAALLISIPALCADPLAEAVTREIIAAENAKLAARVHSFPSEPLVIEFWGLSPLKASPETLTSVANGLAAVYLDFENRDVDDPHGEVVGEGGRAVREAFAVFLLESQALQRASDPAGAFRAMLKFLSMESSEVARAAVFAALKPVKGEQLLSLAEGLAEIAKHGEYTLANPSRLEVHRAADSLLQLEQIAQIHLGCEQVTRMAECVARIPAETRAALIPISTEN